jgi:hypothetical protein
MNEVLRLQKQLMKFTVQCFKEVPSKEDTTLLDSKGNKIWIPSVFDDDELFIDDEDEKFSSLLPTDWEGQSDIPHPDVEKLLKHWNYFIEKLIESIDQSKFKIKADLFPEKFQDYLSINTDPIKSLSEAEWMVYQVVKG